MHQFTEFKKNTFIINIERIMNTCAIYLSSKFNVSMLTTVNLNIIRLIAEALSFKIEKNSVNLLH